MIHYGVLTVGLFGQGRVVAVDKSVWLVIKADICTINTYTVPRTHCTLNIYTESRCKILPLAFTPHYKNRKQLTFVVKSSTINSTAIVQEGAMGNTTIRGNRVAGTVTSIPFFHTRFLSKYTYRASSPLPVFAGTFLCGNKLFPAGPT